MQCSSGWTSIKHNQTSTNDSECSGPTGLQRAHVTPLFISLHWLPVAARIQFKTLMLAYRTTTGSVPSYFYSLLRIYIPYRSLRSASERRLVEPSQRGSKSLSRTFSFTIPSWWNDPPIRTAASLSIFKQQLKAHLFWHYLTSSLNPPPKKNKYVIFLFLFLSFSCYLVFYLNNAWDLMLLALPLYVCLFKMNHFMYSPIVSHFG